MIPAFIPLIRERETERARKIRRKKNENKIDLTIGREATFQ